MDRNMLDVFSRAVEVAVVSHHTQTRKGNGMPYITHPFTVAMLLLEAGCSHEVAVAGLLHDTVEDTSLVLHDIEKTFGARIARIVEECSEHDKSKCWEERKQHTLDDVHTVSEEACMVMCADKLHNIRSTTKEFQTYGDDVWLKFNRGKEKQKWYYEGLVEALGQRVPQFRLYILLKQEVEELFR